ncbi:MAG TPA: divalent-cation tolerance protein CutA [Anaerolineales bacterium]|nr:divalent-cation tolerance protein CutA [Anaerolineales bacterium]
MDYRYIVVLITVPSEEVGEAIAQALLDQRLAACVNRLAPVHSIYTWEGKTSTDEELLLIVKSRADLFAGRLVPAVKALHPYQVPEIVALPVVMGSPDYLEWIDSVIE